jgi:hypothetical protein
MIMLIFVVALGSFGLGRLSKIEDSRVPVAIEYDSFDVTEATSSSSLQQNMVDSHGNATTPPDQTITGKYVASKGGTKYHLPWCSGAQRISENNKIWFNSKVDAEKAGYQPASNCKGI